MPSQRQRQAGEIQFSQPVWVAICLALMLSTRVSAVPAPEGLSGGAFGNLMINLSWQPANGWDPRTLANSTLDHSRGDHDRLQPPFRAPRQS